MQRSLLKSFTPAYTYWGSIVCIAIAGCSNPFATANVSDPIQI